jgi:hypothetical protein
LQLWHSLASCWDGKDDEQFQHCMRKIYELKKNLQPQSSVLFAK